MSKKQKKSKFEVPQEVKDFSRMTWKKFKKETEGVYDTKKEAKSEYYDQLVDLIPDVVKFSVKYSHYSQAKPYMDDVYNKFKDEKFVDLLTTVIEKEMNGELNEALKFLPSFILKLVTFKTKKFRDYQASLKKVEENKSDVIKQVENTFIEFDEETELMNFEPVMKLSMAIMGKKLKKLTKVLNDKKAAFDLLSAIPSIDILSFSSFHHCRLFFSSLYTHCKQRVSSSPDTSPIPKFKDIVKVLCKDVDREKRELYLIELVSFVLLEREEITKGFNSTQLAMYSEVGSYCLGFVENLEKAQIKQIITRFVDSRKMNESQNMDSKRHFNYDLIKNDEYPQIKKVVDKMIKKDETIKKYFK